MTVIYTRVHIETCEHLIPKQVVVSSILITRSTNVVRKKLSVVMPDVYLGYGLLLEYS